MHQTKRQSVGHWCGGFRGSVGMGIPTGFSVDMWWVWGLKFNPHGSPASYTYWSFASR